ncbi:MAG: hypothetical protein HY814_02155 [Candidatus Riflebacteria bacterium]|nr:hypothetical protein [Candidatus Riflebacteria bacterium]
MSRIIHLRRESWVTRLWWSLWRWMRPAGPKPDGVAAKVEAATAVRPLSPQMAHDLLASQRRVVDELRRLNQILARTNTDLGVTSRQPARRHNRSNVHDLMPRLRPKLQS